MGRLVTLRKINFRAQRKEMTVLERKAAGQRQDGAVTGRQEW